MFLAGKQVDEVIFTSRYCYYCVHKEEQLKGAGIIVPIRNVLTPFDLKWYEWISIGRMLVKAKNYIELHHSPDGYNIGWNVGSTAGQTFMHTHLHIIPRYQGDKFEGQGIKKCLKEKLLND